jgi:tRNA-binding EMAP/Myf-like protein
MILVMKVESAADVEDSKNLRVYTFKSEDKSLVVVANRTNVYEENDIVAVAQVGSVPEHFGNFEITQRKVFGIESHGMAIGKVDLDVGTELEDGWNPNA